MPKNRNMGRRSHQQLDAELEITQAGMMDDATAEQTPRPTMHPSQGKKGSKEQPLQSHSRRGA